jgi:hypothetical protein
MAQATARAKADPCRMTGKRTGNDKGKAKASAKCGGLSTTQEAVRLSVASVEMTAFWKWATATTDPVG